MSDSDDEWNQTLMSAKEKANKLYDEAKKLALKSDFAASLKLLKQAFELHPDPKIKKRITSLEVSVEKDNQKLMKCNLGVPGKSRGIRKR